MNDKMKIKRRILLVFLCSQSLFAEKGVSEFTPDRLVTYKTVGDTELKLGRGMGSLTIAREAGARIRMNISTR